MLPAPTTTTLGFAAAAFALLDIIASSASAPERPGAGAAPVPALFLQ
jgi:hypothetical protein